MDKPKYDSYIFQRPAALDGIPKTAPRYGKPTNAAQRLRIGDWLEIFLMAFIIAFLFKAVAFEPSVVPTNSMAPTIYGKTWEDIGGNRFSRDNNDEYYRALQSSKMMLHAQGINPDDMPESKLVSRRIGERVIVNKFIYGAWFPGTLIPTLNADWIRLPAIRKPSRGDIVVFSPVGMENGHEYWVKRVIGLPGEKVVIRDGYVYINDVRLDESQWLTESDREYYHGGHRHEYFILDSIPDRNYFVMGDNRNESRDSRYIGVIPERNLRGKVIFRFLPLNRFGVVL